MSRDATLLLEDIAAACTKIMRFAAGLGSEEFLADELASEALLWEVVRHKVPSLLDDVTRILEGGAASEP